MDNEMQNIISKSTENYAKEESVQKCSEAGYRGAICHLIESICKPAAASVFLSGKCEQLVPFKTRKLPPSLKLCCSGVMTV